MKVLLFLMLALFCYVAMTACQDEKVTGVSQKKKLSFTMTDPGIKPENIKITIMGNASLQEQQTSTYDIVVANTSESAEDEFRIEIRLYGLAYQGISNHSWSLQTTLKPKSQWNASYNLTGASAGQIMVNVGFSSSEDFLQSKTKDIQITPKPEELIYGLPPEIWNACKYEYNGESMLDMSTPTWRNLSWQDQGKYARMYQVGYAKAKRLELEIMVDPGRANIAMVLIPPGRFLMGSPENEPGRDFDEIQHLAVITRPYYLGKTEVTQAQWQAVMGSNPSYFQKAGQSAPVEQVSWGNCQNFCQKLGGRLPTETEWEFAARSGVTRMTYAGDFEIKGANHAPGLDPIAWYGGNSGVSYEGGDDSSGWSEKQYAHTRAGTHPVAQKQPNHYGLYDTIGNVWEWCQDYYGAYPTSQVIDYQEVTSPLNRVLRGGLWSHIARYCRAADRYYLAGSYNNIGFRFLRSIP